jgi:hypothetical protein
MGREEGEMLVEGERERSPHQRRHRQLDPGRTDASTSSRPVCVVASSKRYEEDVSEPFRAGTSESFEGGRTHERSGIGIVSNFHV